MSSELSENGHDRRRLRDLFDVACDLEEPELGAYIDRNCAGQPALRAALEKLLSADREAVSRILWQAPAAAAEARDMAGQASLPFERLGEYRILSRIGAGGMGAVYLAERDYEDVRKRVAIKIIPRVFVDDDTVRRFRQERQILARLEHPNIARMLDAGTTGDGVPYLVMEYVEGVPLNRYVAEQYLNVRARLDLFRAICDAVAFAHRNLVVHRDLKPGNILVTAEGVPKLLDFGIARLVSASEEATSAAILTPAYASPEQLAGGAITTASDVYSLGVILYEILAGAKPYAAETPAAAVRAQKREPARPSALLRKSSRRRVNADLDNVVLMALRKEPERRYPSVCDLADDVRRAMEGYPVRARPNTLRYRALRFAARRRWEVGVAAAMAAVLAVAATVAMEQYRAAQQRFRDVRAIANSLLFDVYDAVADQPGTTKARSILALRAQRYLDVLARDQSGNVALRRELATAYRKLADILGQPFAANLGDIDGAVRNYRKAAEVLEGIAVPGSHDASVFVDLGDIYSKQGQLANRQHAFEDSVAALEKSVRAREKAAALDPSSHDVQRVLVNGQVSLASARLELGKARNDLALLRSAEAIDLSALAAAQKLAAQEPGKGAFQVMLSRTCEFLAYIESSLASRTGDREFAVKAVRYHQQEYDVTKLLYAQNPDRYRRSWADALADLSRGRFAAGDARGSETSAREGLRVFQEIAARDPDNYEAARDTVVARWDLANALAAQHRSAEAAAEFRAVLSGSDRLYRRNPQESRFEVAIDSRDQLAAIAMAAGNSAAAIQQYQRNIEILAGASNGADMVTLALDYELLGNVLMPADPAHAAATYEQAARLWDKLRESHQLPEVYAGKPSQLRERAQR